MTVTEVIKERSSIRAYKPDTIDKALIMEILEIAARTPSWANSQPWTVYVASGESLANIKKSYLDNYANAVKTGTDIPRPTEWPAAARERTMGLRPDMLRDCEEAADSFGELNQRMFDAPTVIFLCLDKMYSHWSLYDLGAYAQSLCLLAQERGLSTIPAITSVQYPNAIRSELNIPDNLNIAIGIPIGYKDENNKINNFHSARSPLEETVSYHS